MLNETLGAEASREIENLLGKELGAYSFHNANEELDVIRQFLSESRVTGRVITLDALHASFESVGLIVEA